MKDQKFSIMVDYTEYSLEHNLMLIIKKDGVPDMKNALCLNQTAKIVWQGIKDGLTFDQICDQIEELYATSGDIRRDATMFIDALISKGIISAQ